MFFFKTAKKMTHEEILQMNWNLETIFKILAIQSSQSRTKILKIVHTRFKGATRVNVNLGERVLTWLTKKCLTMN